MTHVTVHGKLDNLAGTDAVYAGAIVDAIRAFDRTLIVAVQDGELEKAALTAGLAVGYTFMADRAYESDGQPASRDKPGAVLHDTDAIAERTIRVIQEGTVRSIDGVDIAMLCDAVLVHGDNAEAVANARGLRARIESAGVRLDTLEQVVAANKRGRGAPRM
jgi:UPF0271 protein